MQERVKMQHVLVKMYRSTDRLMVAAPLPGLEPEDILIEITQDNHMLIQGGVRGMLKDIKELLLDEWSVGNYYRKLDLPNTVDGKNANVTYRNGVLVVALPLSQHTTTAKLMLEKVGTAYGEHVGNTGHAPTRSGS